MFRFVMSRLYDYTVNSHMLNENWRRGKRVVFSSELIKKRRETHVKVKVKFTLKRATKTQKGSRGVALLFP